MKSFIRKFLSVMIICSMTFVSLGITAFAGPVKDKGQIPQYRYDQRTEEGQGLCHRKAG